MVVSHPVSWLDLFDCGWIPHINYVLDFFRLTYIPLLVSISPKIFPTWTPNEHLLRFRRMLYFMKELIMSSRLLQWFISFGFFMTTHIYRLQVFALFGLKIPRPSISGRWHWCSWDQMELPCNSSCSCLSRNPFLCVQKIHLDMIVDWIDIYEAHHCIPRKCWSIHLCWEEGRNYDTLKSKFFIYLFYTS